GLSPQPDSGLANPSQGSPVGASVKPLDPETRAAPRAEPDAGMRLFGREQELRAAFTLLDGTGPRALTLAGEPGIGKTAIWRELLERARERGWEVLCAMPSSA